ncbi:MAG: OB-fold nucleic acid binding domain-containing protein, partial [Dehalococcoidia bacterium]
MSQQRTAGPAPAIMADQLRKVLLLEQERGFTDSAVMGGVDRFLKRWSLEAHRALVHPMFRASLRRLGLVSPDYASKSPDQRAEWVRRVLQWADGFAADARRDDGLPAKPSGARPATSPKRRQRPPPAGGGLRPGQSLDTPLAEAQGFTQFMIGKLARLGVTTVRDLLYFFPRRHIDFSRTSPIAELEVGRDQTVMGTVWEASEVQLGATRRRATEAVIGDESGNVRAIWFNQPYVARNLRPGMRIALSGRVALYRGRAVFENPEYEPVAEKELVHTARLVPVYPLTEGLTSRRLRTLIKRVVDACAAKVADFLPSEQRQRRGLMELPQAIRQAHFPASPERKEQARRRLAFDELLLIQLGVLRHKREWKHGNPGHPLPADPQVLDALYQTLPFPLTGAQRRSIQEVVADLGRSTAMSRLLQG